MKKSLKWILLIIFVAIPAVVNTQTSSDKAQLSYVAYQYLIREGWDLVYIHGIEEREVDMRKKKILVVSSSLLTSKRYYTLDSIFTGYFHEGWTWCKGSFFSAIFLDFSGKELTLYKYDPPLTLDPPRMVH